MRGSRTQCARAKRKSGTVSQLALTPALSRKRERGKGMPAGEDSLMRLADRSERCITDLKPGHAAMWPHWQPISKSAQGTHNVREP